MVEGGSGCCGGGEVDWKGKVAATTVDRTLFLGWRRGVVEGDGGKIGLHAVLTLVFECIYKKNTNHSSNPILCSAAARLGISERSAFVWRMKQLAGCQIRSGPLFFMIRAWQCTHLHTMRGVSKARNQTHVGDDSALSRLYCRAAVRHHTTIQRSPNPDTTVRSRATQTANPQQRGRWQAVDK